MSAQNRTEEGLLASFVSVGGLVSCGISVFLWVVSQHEKGQAQALDLAHSVESLADLRRLFSVLPVLIAVRGRVGSTAPKRCELGEVDAVVHEIVEEEIYRKERENGRVTQEAFEVRRVFTQCEWFLEDSSASRVRVENANQADSIRSCMDTKQTFFPEEPAKSSLANLILEKAMRSMHKYGVRKTEKFLPVGREVTVIGELSRSPATWTGLDTRTPNSGSSSSSSSSSKPSTGGGAIPGAHYVSNAARDAAPEPSAPPFPFSLLSSAAVVYNSGGGEESGSQGMGAGLSFIPFVVRRPSTGPFYITPLTLSQLRSALSSRARTIKYVSYGFGALGAFLIVRKAVSQLLSMHRRHTIRKRVAAAEKAHQAAVAARAAAIGGPSTSQTGSSGRPQSAAGRGGALGSDEEGRGAGICVVCMELPSEMVFTSCGHMCCCYNCGHMMSRCPMCRTRGPSIKVFRS